MDFFPFTINKSKIGLRDNKHRVYNFKEKEPSPLTVCGHVVLESIKENVYKAELIFALKIIYNINEQNLD